jgi:hypothetical protein
MQIKSKRVARTRPGCISSGGQRRAPAALSQAAEKSNCSPDGRQAGPSGKAAVASVVAGGFGDGTQHGSVPERYRRGPVPRAVWNRRTVPCGARPIAMARWFRVPRLQRPRALRRCTGRATIVPVQRLLQTDLSRGRNYFRLQQATAAGRVQDHVSSHSVEEGYLQHRTRAYFFRRDFASLGSDCRTIQRGDASVGTVGREFSIADITLSWPRLTWPGDAKLILPGLALA